MNNNDEIIMSEYRCKSNSQSKSQSLVPEAGYQDISKWTYNGMTKINIKVISDGYTGNHSINGWTFKEQEDSND
jgi:hypothetical protein